MKKSIGQVVGQEAFKGVVRKTLAYNDEIMMGHFQMAKGASIPLHSHRASQAGYILSGSIKFSGKGNEGSFVAGPGDSYVFGPHQEHAAEVLEEAEVIEVFSPVREEYKDS